MKILCFSGLMFLSGPLAWANQDDTASWLGTYADVLPESGRVRAAVRISREDDSLVADFWKNGVIRRIGKLIPVDGASFATCDTNGRYFHLSSYGMKGERRVLAVGSAWTVLINAGEMLSEDPDQLSQHIHVEGTSRFVEDRVSLQRFIDGSYVEVPPFSDCEIALMQ